MMWTTLALAALIAPWVAAGAGLVGRHRQAEVARAAAAVTGLGFAAAAGLGIATVVSGADAVSVGAGAFMLTLDGLAIVMTLLVLGLSGVIQSFATRYLRGDSRQGWFVITANLLTASTVLMVGAGTVVLFTVAWVAAGISLVLLLNTYPHDRQAKEGVRRTVWRFVVGDLSLLAAAAMLILAGGMDLRLAEVGTVLAGMPDLLAAAVGVLLVAAALARSSQIPFHGWLPATLAAPTPVSALMHAGVVNAGAILLIRFSSAIADSTLTMAVVFVAGATTLVYASAVRLIKPDVKGRLVFSTMAQMGFMIMACGLGAFAAAVFHLVAHGLYKSALFLSAGTGVRQQAARRVWPDRPHRGVASAVAAVGLAVIVPLGAVASARALFAPDVSAASAALLAFVVLAGAVTLGSTLLVRLSIATVAVSFLAIISLTLVYTVFVVAFEDLLGSVAAVGAVSPWWVLAPAALLIITQWLASDRIGASAVRDVLYARGLSAATPALHPVKGI